TPDRVRPHEHRARTPGVTEIARGVHGDAARPAAGGGGVHSHEPSVRMLTPEKRDVEHPLHPHVVDEERAAREEPRVLVAPYALTDLPSRLHHTPTEPPPRCSDSRCTGRDSRRALRGSHARRDGDDPAGTAPES